MRHGRLKALFALAFYLLMFFSCAEEPVRLPLTINKKDGTQKQVQVELALTQEQQQKGFMERKNIPDGTGMLFVFEKDQILSFWMKNTPTALSIAYIDSKGVIRNIFDMSPFSLETIQSTVSVRYALEVPQGWFSANGITTGDAIFLEDLSW